MVDRRKRRKAKRKIVKEKKYIIIKLSENEYNKKAVYIFKQPDKMFLIEP